MQILKKFTMYTLNKQRVHFLIIYSLDKEIVVSIQYRHDCLWLNRIFGVNRDFITILQIKIKVNFTFEIAVPQRLLIEKIL